MTHCLKLKCDVAMLGIGMISCEVANLTIAMQLDIYDHRTILEEFYVSTHSWSPLAYLKL